MKTISRHRFDGQFRWVETIQLSELQYKLDQQHKIRLRALRGALYEKDR